MAVPRLRIVKCADVDPDPTWSQFCGYGTVRPGMSHFLFFSFTLSHPSQFFGVAFWISLPFFSCSDSFFFLHDSIIYILLLIFVLVIPPLHWFPMLSYFIDFFQFPSFMSNSFFWLPVFSAVAIVSHGFSFAHKLIGLVLREIWQGTTTVNFDDKNKNHSFRFPVKIFP